TIAPNPAVALSSTRSRSAGSWAEPSLDAPGLRPPDVSADRARRPELDWLGPPFASNLQNVERPSGAAHRLHDPGRDKLLPSAERHAAVAAARHLPDAQEPLRARLRAGGPDHAHLSTHRFPAAAGER